MGGRTSQIKRTLRRSNVPRGSVVANNPICLCGTSWELGVTQEARAQVAHPKIHVVRSRPGVRTTLRSELHGVIRAK